MSNHQLTPVAWRCGRFYFDWQKNPMPLVMGILNVTPDSFSDGGRFVARDAALKQAEIMMAEGASIIDIGGESSRPGSEPLSLQEELDRVMPVLEALQGCDIALSVDTYKAKTMQAALALGVDCINDIWAMRQPNAIDTVKASRCGIVLMHMQKDPQTMQFKPEYQDVISEVNSFLLERCAMLEKEGVGRERLVLDPGFGFGKTLAHNMQMLSAFDTFTHHGLPALAGISRKSSLGEITGRKTEDRMVASVAAALMAVERGAKIVRVHDVGPTVDALKVWSAATQSL